MKGLLVLWSFCAGVMFSGLVFHCSYAYGHEPVEVVVVLDKSGSMKGLASDTIGELNVFIEKQKALRPEAKFTLALFDTAYETLYAGAQMADVKPVTAEQYQPGGYTALYDAVGRTLKDLEGRGAENVVFVVFTDGLENSSSEYGSEDIKQKVAHLEGKPHGYKFVYLGSDPDAWAQNAVVMGFSVGTSSMDLSTSGGITDAWSTTNNAVNTAIEGMDLETDEACVENDTREACK